MLIRITGPNFVAGAIMDDGEIIIAAPIVRWAIGMTELQLRAELVRRGLTATLVKTLKHAEIACGADRPEHPPESA